MFICLCVATASAAPPWALTPLAPGGAWTALDVAVGDLTLARARVSPSTEAGPAALVVETRCQRARPTRLAVALFGADRQPLAALCETVEVSPAARPVVTRQSVCQLELPLPDLGPDAVRYLAAGPVARPVPPGASLCAAEQGGRVSAVTSEYSASYSGQMVLDGRPNTYYASATGQIVNVSLTVDLPGESMPTIAEIGIDGRGEPGYPKSALRRFVVLASDTDTADPSFREVLRGECGFGAGLQRWPVTPFRARHLRLLCLDNWGDDKWLELASFECYAPAAPVAAPAELVQVVADYEDIPAVASPAVEGFGLGLMLREGVGGMPPPAPAPLAWPMVLEGCREGTARLESVQGDGGVFGALRLDFAFGNLLGGAPQSCAAVLDAPLAGAPRRLQLALRTDRPGNLLRAALARADGPLAWIELGRLPNRAWRAVSVPLPVEDTAWRLVRLAVVPKGRENLTGTVWVDEILALSAPSGG